MAMRRDYPDNLGVAAHYKPFQQSAWDLLWHLSASYHPNQAPVVTASACEIAGCDRKFRANVRLLLVKLASVTHVFSSFMAGDSLRS